MLDAATLCGACGAARHESTPTGSFEKHGDLSTANQPTAVPPPRFTTKEAGAAQPEWQCPKCTSENIQRLSVVHSEGSAFFTSSSKLAMSAAPPAAPTQPSGTVEGCAVAIVILFLSVILSWILGGFIFNVVENDYRFKDDNLTIFLVSLFFFVVLPVYLAAIGGSHVRDSLERAQQAEYPAKLAAYNQAMAKWQRSYFCHRCGNIFELQSS